MSAKERRLPVALIAQMRAFEFSIDMSLYHVESIVRQTCGIGVFQEIYQNRHNNRKINGTV